MVSDKASGLPAALLLAAIFVAGCSSLTPVRYKAEQAGGSGVTEKREAPVTAGLPAPLPRQAYTASGEKIPYVAQPNPYTATRADIPQDARSEFVMANSRLGNGNVKGARETFRKLTEDYPTLSGPWLKLGDIAEQQEAYDEAVSHYQKAISVNRNNVNAHILLGLLQRRLGNFRAAEDAYVNALRTWRDCPEGHLNLAILYDLYLNRPEEAQKHYEAYAFLVGVKDKKAKKWLVEVKQRTGIERSFVDIPPKEVAASPTAGAGETGVTAAAGDSGQAL